jgi:hypothetical protein
MQTSISRKLHKVDNTNMPDLKTEVTALTKNLTGSLPVKLTQVLIDTCCSKTLIKKQYVPNGLNNAKKVCQLLGVQMVESLTPAMKYLWL